MKKFGMKADLIQPRHWGAERNRNLFCKAIALNLNPNLNLNLNLNLYALMLIIFQVGRKTYFYLKY